MRFLVPLFSGLCLMGCDSSGSGGSLVIHDNGLVAIADSKYETFEETDNGFVFYVNREGARQVEYSIVELSDSNEMPRAQTRTIDGISYSFNLDKVSVGSGGSEYTLRIWKPLNPKGVMLEHYVQSESTPDFIESWGLIESANVQPESR